MVVLYHHSHLIYYWKRYRLPGVSMASLSIHYFKGQILDYDRVVESKDPDS